MHRSPQFREAEKLKDRFEVSLDTRQIFLMFCSCAVVLGLVFAGGVVVGKRLPAESASVGDDPLALLDRLEPASEVKPDVEFTYPETLGASATDKSNRQTVSKVAAKRSKSSSRRGQAATAPRKKLAKRKETMATPAKRSAPAGLSDTPEPRRGSARQSAAGTGLRKPIATGAKHALPPQKKRAPARPYTLQLSSFRDQLEAELFVKKLARAGVHARVQRTAIPRRGTWYRVRVGQYDSWKEAVAAKSAFEKDQRIIAYVARN